ncbi:MAG: hypothetical protein B6229_06830 [Spirochaetaceae bacterium 4572_7]|nr:MAG: hypothetical protein B6229_06830 [Spirochaetaceae bacterium 4572_7]
MIDIINLEKNYGSTRAVRGIDLTINSGEILGLLGPNGAGKSSTLRILTGYLKPSSGTIHVKGLDVIDDDLKIKKLIGYLPESAPLYSDMLVYDYLQYIAEIRELPKDKITPRLIELAELCGIKDVMHKSINELSKGYKQRVGLAQAMMADPEILVLDEPTTGLDPNQIVEIRNIIKEIGKKKTVILSTHILSEAEATCDRIVIINNGKIAADGTPEELKKILAGEVRIDITLKKVESNVVEKHFSNFQGIESLTVTQLENETFISIYAAEDIRENLYLKIKESNWVMLNFSLKVKSLENIFRTLTKEDNNEK